MKMAWLHLIDPLSGKPLRFTGAGSLSDYGYLTDEAQSRRWPVAMGIAYLRSDRLDLAERVVDLILVGKHVEAIGSLLQDTDDFAPSVPELHDCERLAARLLANDGDLYPRDMMDALRLGPVADYFALRGSAPTFFSGLGLLKISVSLQRPLIEVGCGIGHFIYWLKKRGVEAVGIDSVFSKLCLAHRFLGVNADHLICAVAGKDSSLPMATTDSTSVFCHDAFYFIENKAHSLSEFRRLAGPDGVVAIGHAHLASADHGKVSGYPCSIEAYRSLAAPNAHLFDDSALVAFGAGTGPLDHAISQTVEAISFVEGVLPVSENAWWDCDEELLQTPIEITWPPKERRTHMTWPSEAFTQEYRVADYLLSPRNPFEYLPIHGNLAATTLHPGLAIPSPFFALSIRPLRWGVIGGGWIASDYFIPAFQFTPHAKLVGLAEPNAERRKTYGENTELPIFGDWREMVESCRLDAVYIATPNDLHAEIFEGAAAAGLRILCEKPLATNLKDLRRIRNCIRHAPDFFQTAYDQRYHPAHLSLARRIAEGALGTITQIRIHYACWVDGAWNKVIATDNWRINRSRAGGGAGFDLLPHCLDLISVLVNDSILEAHLLYQGRVHDYAINQAIDDGAVMTVKTKGGILASIHVGYHCPEDQPRRRIEIIGTLGRVEAINTMGQDPGGELVWQVAEGVERESFPTGAEAGPFVRQLDAMSRLWIRGDVPQFSFGRDLMLAERLVACDARARLESILEFQQL